MAHDGDKKRDARRRYVRERQGLPMIALATGIPERTIARWKAEAKADGDDWEASRAANTISGDGLDAVLIEVIEDYIVQHRAAIEDLKTEKGLSAIDRAKTIASLSDSFTKMISASGKVSPKISELGIAMDVLTRLGDFIGRTRPDLAPALLEVLEPFGEALSQSYG